jgi:hypothetical protein
MLASIMEISETFFKHYSSLFAFHLFDLSCCCIVLRSPLTTTSPNREQSLPPGSLDDTLDSKVGFHPLTVIVPGTCSHIDKLPSIDVVT